MAQERGQGRFDQDRGQHFGVLSRKVVGSDQKPMHLRTVIAEAQYVDPERLVITSIDRE
jgi:hypothetical protein